MDRTDVRIADVDKTRIIAQGPMRSLRDIRRRPSAPRGLRFFRGSVTWAPPERPDGVTHYKIYVEDENSLHATVPAGQLQIGGISASRVFVSAFNAANGQESTKAAYNSVVYPGLPVVSGAMTHREIQAIIDDLPVEGGEIWLGPGDWSLGAPIIIPSDKPNIRIYGSGDATNLVRNQLMPTGVGVFDISADNCEIRNLRIDGNVLTSVGITYATVLGAMGGDPMHATLSDQTSIWIHGGVSGTRISGVTITHTGGYAILVDARTDDVVDTQISACKFINNRPHKFGDGADLNYGSWSGGIMYHNDGRNPSTSAVRGLKVSNCEWRRNTGNCLWGHAYGFNVLNERISFTENAFQDCGLDGIQPGNVVGGIVANNHFHRIGYIHSTDIDATVPKYRADAYAVALDSTGFVKGVDYVGNSMVSVNGGGIDLDGFAEGNVSGNSIIIPSPGEDRYVEDKVAQYGAANANITKGIQTGNTFYGPGARQVNITGNTIRNCGTSAIVLKDARQCFVSSNAIWHSVNPSVIGVFGIPILLLSTSASDPNHQVKDNVITGNFIHWDIPQAQLNTVVPQSNYCIHESDDVLAPVPGPNYVFGNKIIGLNYGEFSRGATSVGSTSSMVIPTSAPITSANRISQTIQQREGFSTTAATKWYRQFDDAGTQRTKVMMQLSDIGPSLLIYTVDNAGAIVAQSGRVLTGGRTSAGTMEDFMFSGKLIADGFLMIGKTTFQDADANQFPDTLGLIRYDPVGKKFEASTATSAGARVWFNLTSSGGASGVTQIVGTSNQIETVPLGGTGIVTLKFAVNVSIGDSIAHTGSLAVFGTATNAIQCPFGFFTGRGLIATETAYNAIQAPTGGINVINATVRRYINLVGVAALTPVAGDSFGATSSQIWYYTGGSRTRISGAFGLIVDGSGSNLIEGITLSSGYVNSAHGFQSLHTAFNTIQLLNGGAYLKQCVAKMDGYIVENSAGSFSAFLDALSGYGELRLQSSGQPTVTAGRHFANNWGAIECWASSLNQVTIQASAVAGLSNSIVIRNTGFQVRISMGVDASGRGAIGLAGGALGMVLQSGGVSDVGCYINGQKIIGARRTDPGAPSFASFANVETWCGNLRAALGAAGGGHGLF